MRNFPCDTSTLDEADYTPALARNPDSSVAAQYEDSVPSDLTEEEYEPS